MKTLVIPDIHEAYGRLQAILQRWTPQVDHTVFLGDYFDSYTHDRQDVVLMLRWMKKSLGRADYTFLLGNHDAHYLHPYMGYCSGYTEDTKILIQEAITDDLKAHFKPWTWVGDDILCSHAGLSNVWAKRVGTDLPDIKASLDKDLERWSNHLGVDGLIHGCGYARGGRDERSGVIWCDWNREFQPIPGLRQIMGHTRSVDNVPRWNPAHESTNLCLDTELEYVAIVDDGVIRVEKAVTA